MFIDKDTKEILNSHTGRIMKLTGWTAWQISRILRDSGMNIVELHNHLVDEQSSKLERDKR